MKEEAEERERSTAKLAPVVDLLEWKRSGKTVSHLRWLLSEAEAGRIAGILIAAQCMNGDMMYIGSGSLCDVPVLGAAAAQHLLAKMLT